MRRVCKWFVKKKKKGREERNFSFMKGRVEGKKDLKNYFSLSLSDYYLSGFLRITILIIDTNIENLFKTISVD